MNIFSFCDIYIHDIDLYVEINGPSHYFEDSQRLLPNLMDCLNDLEGKNILRIKTIETTEKVLKFGKLESDLLDDSNLVELKQQIKLMIENKLLEHQKLNSAKKKEGSLEMD